MEGVMKKRRVLILIIALVVFSIVCLSAAADYKYVGSSKSDKYHYPSCEWAAKINPDNLVKFKSAKEALDAGYIPCKVCRPPNRD
jgi:methylphosphotriester-DNA--protein-cysteine methyltransferase